MDRFYGLRLVEIASTDSGDSYQKSNYIFLVENLS